nr:MAG TPA: hypothetical protein [Caudoviricetes sp.]
MCCILLRPVVCRPKVQYQSSFTIVSHIDVLLETLYQGAV